jgi:hypothetical protein
MDKDNQEQDKNLIRKSVEDLLNEEPNLPSNGGGLPAFQLNEPIDYDEMKASSMNKSKKMMNSLLKFYLSQELIDQNEYIQAKAKLEMLTLSNLLQQMQYSERAITTLMRTIDTGEVTPRMFEVLAGLQKTMLDIMKHQTLHMMAAEENMKKLKRDIDVYGNESGTSESKPTKKIESGNVARGTRNLMKEIQAELGNEEPEEDPTDFDAESQSEL